MTDVKIRAAHPGDMDQLVELLESLFTIEADFECDAARQRRGLEMLLGHDSARVVVATAQGRVIGMATGQLTISTAEGGYALLVEDVVVTTIWQGRGVGKKLLQALEEWSRRHKVERLQLLADQNNRPALDFYTKLGWQGTELVCLRRRLPASQ